MMTRLSVTVTRALTTDDKPLLPRETFMVGPGGFQSVDAGCLAFGVQTPEPAQETDRRRTNRNDDGVIECLWASDARPPGRRLNISTARAWLSACDRW